MKWYYLLIVGAVFVVVISLILMLGMSAQRAG